MAFAELGDSKMGFFFPTKAEFAVMPDAGQGEFLQYCMQDTRLALRQDVRLLATRRNYVLDLQVADCHLCLLQYRQVSRLPVLRGAGCTVAEAVSHQQSASHGHRWRLWHAQYKWPREE